MPGFPYLAAFAWGFVLLAAFAGWGLAATRLLRLRDDWGQAIARGIALSTVAGGALNLLRAISAWSLALWVAAGVAWLVALPRPGRRRAGLAPHPGPSPLDALALAALLISYSTWLCLDAPIDGPPWRAYALNPSDDYEGYALLPLQMLRAGAMADDPFNDRRSMAGLGGEPFLQALGLLFLPLPYIHLVDPGVTHLAMAAALYSMARRRRWPRALPGALILLYAVVPTDAWNASAVATPGVLLLSLYRTMAEERPAQGGTVARAAALALPLAGVLTLKYTAFPGALALVGLGTLARMVAGRRPWRPPAEGLLAVALALALILPWMVASARACGTPLYPFLGEGYRTHSTVAIPHKHANRSLRQLADQVYWNAKGPRMVGCGLAALGALLALARGGVPRRRLAATLAALGASALTLAAFLVIFPATASYRYSYPFYVLLLLASFDAILGRDPARGPGPAASRPLRRCAWLLLAALTLRLAADLRPIARTALDSAWGGLTNRPFIEPEDPPRYRRLQARIPERAGILCLGDQNDSVIKPFLFDFTRNVFYVHDIPGCLSPPPGIPLTAGADALAAYLRRLGIRYLVLHAERDTPEQLMAKAAGIRGSDNWIASMTANYARLTGIVNEYIRRGKVLYEEGGDIALDLELDSSADPPPGLGPSPAEASGGAHRAR